MTQVATRPFNASGYEILDEDLPSKGLAVIWSTRPTAPRHGDAFLIESGGRLYDVAVESVDTFRGGWSATCRQA